MTTTPKEGFYTCEEVAELLNVDYQTVARWCREKRLKAKKYGQIWRIPRSQFSDLDAEE